MTGLFNRSEKEKKAVDAQSKRRAETKLLKEGITLKRKKENFQITEKRKKRRKETQY